MLNRHLSRRFLLCYFFNLFFLSMYAQNDLVYINTEESIPETIDIRGDDNIVFKGDNIVLNRIEIPEGAIKKIEIKYQKLLSEIRQKVKIQQLNEERYQQTINQLEVDTRTAILQADQLSKRFKRIDFDKSSQLFDRAYQAFQTGDFDIALNLLSEAQLEEQDRKNADNRKLKASLHAIQFEFDLAAFNYRRAADIYEVFNNVFDYAYFFLLQTKYGEAEIQFERALNIANEDIQTATTNTNLGMIWRAKNNPQIALKYYGDAAKIYQKLLKTNPEYIGQTATALNNVGNVLMDLESFKEATSILKNAMIIRRELAKIDSNFYEPELATTIMNIGLLYRRQNQLDSAIVYYQKALSYKQKFAGTGQPKSQAKLALLLNNLGDVYQEKAIFEEAQKFYEQSLNYYERLAKNNPDAYQVDVADVLNNLAYLEYELGNNHKAISKYERAKDIYELYLSTKPKSVLSKLGHIYHNYGLCLDKIQAKEKAFEMFKKAVKTRRQLFNKQYPETKANLAQSLNSIANIYTDYGMWDKGLTAYKEAFDLRSSLAKVSPQVYTLDLTESIINLGIFHLSVMQHTYDEESRRLALEQFNNALALLQYFPDHPRALKQQTIALQRRDYTQTVDLVILKLDKELTKLQEEISKEIVDTLNLADIILQLERIEQKYTAKQDSTGRVEFLYHYSWILESFSPSLWSGEEVISVQQKIIKWREKAFLEIQDNNTQNDLATSWGLLSGYILHETTNYSEAIGAARKGLELATDQNWIKINLALAYVMIKDYETAINGILRKDLTHPFDFIPEKTYQEIFIKELNILEEKGKLDRESIKKLENMMEH